MTELIVSHWDSDTSSAHCDSSVHSGDSWCGRKVWDTLDRYIFSCMEPAALDLRRYDLKWETDCRQFAQLTRLNCLNTSMKCVNEMLKLLSWKCFGDRKMLFALVTTCDHTNACKILWGRDIRTKSIEHAEIRQQFVAISGKSYGRDPMGCHWMPRATSCCVMLRHSLSTVWRFNFEISWKISWNLLKSFEVVQELKLAENYKRHPKTRKVPPVSRIPGSFFASVVHRPSAALHSCFVPVWFAFYLPKFLSKILYGNFPYFPMHFQPFSYLPYPSFYSVSNLFSNTLSLLSNF